MTYAERHAALVAYLTMKTEEGDWHGVSDAANDLRVLEATFASQPQAMFENGTFTKDAWDGLVRINRPPAPVPGDEGPAPPPPPLRPKRIIPTDPDELRSEAIRLMDQGFGMNEVKEQLELTETQAQQFFFNQ